MMQKTFTGNSKRVRNVNLSGRTPNPWANLPASSTNTTSHTLVNAQVEREKRQRDREKLHRTKILQRLVRGRSDRRRVRAEWRAQWDGREAASGPVRPVNGSSLQESGALALNAQEDHFSERRPTDPRSYSSTDEFISQLRLLVSFAQVSHPADRDRMGYFGVRLKETMSAGTVDLTTRETNLMKRLAILCIRAVANVPSFKDDRGVTIELLQLLNHLPKLIPTQMAELSDHLFHLLSHLISSQQPLDNVMLDLMLDNILSVLSPITGSTLIAYTAFATKLLPNPNLEQRIGSLQLKRILHSINYKLLASCLATAVSASRTTPILEDHDQRLWLLARFILAHNEVIRGNGRVGTVHDMDFIIVVSALLGSLADEVSTRIDVADIVMGASSDRSSKQLPQPLDPFIKAQIRSLVQQNSISNLLSPAISATTQGGSNKEAQALATYALTLLRVFPAKAEDIRSWLFLSPGPSNTSQRISPIRFFWQSTKRTDIFLRISKDQKQVLDLLRPPSDKGSNRLEPDQWNMEWQIILLFLELYIFVLKFMDDEEFLKGGNYSISASDSGQSWTREGSLPLEDVKNLTIFLKNLAFTLYWNASDLADDVTKTTVDEATIRNYFAVSSDARPSRRTEEKQEPQHIAGMLGVAHKYMKELVTGLLRMIHQRDSRRRFLLKDHWLMTSAFDISSFIPTVVAEEERRLMMGEEYEEEDRDFEGDPLDFSVTDHTPHGLLPISRAQRSQQIELVRKNQENAAKKKILESVAPRLEILRNLPFFIPFDTRVQIFREFVYRDQSRRRNGAIDPDNWRMSVIASGGIASSGRHIGQDIISRHHASIRRNAVFQSAFEQFYQLGDSLKEPIQISFIDQFGTTEAGIDGGGVTKEFLTSVTTEAFNPTGDLDLFVENEQHLLYPNPGAIEERKELLRQAQFPEDSPEWREELSNLMRQYEFLGRIIGKCMYEGILVDVNFAGFFLIKWSLTGGTTSASNESAYKPNLNDLRDLDEGLYQGLLQLKNYPGNVEDFSLTFTITDTFTLPTSDPSSPMSSRPTKSIDHDLVASGSNRPVTNANRLHYLQLVTRHRLLTQQYYQTRSFLAGLGQIISPSWLSMFNQSELQTLISGDTATEIDIDDLRANTQYGGLYVIGDDGQEHPVIRMFWDVMSSLPNETRKKVLKFVTSTPRPPLGGFRHLNPKFSIRDSGAGIGEGDADDRLPSTSTCVNLLKLPRYRSKERLREKLVYSVESGAGFDLS